MPEPPASEVAVEVSGFARGRFEPVVEMFARLTGSLMAAGGGSAGGAALAVMDGGELVVDLVAGDYQPDSLQLLFSVSKAISAVAAAIAHRDGLLDLDAPLGSYWPAFSRPATAMISVRDVLAHRSGLASFERRLSFEELLAGQDEAAIEVQDPYWEPNTAHGYHAFTYGTLINGVFRRALGQTVGEFLAERVSGPLGLDLWLGAPAEVLPRVAQILYGPSVTTPDGRAWAAVNQIPPSASGQLQATMDFYNDPAVAQACLPSTSGIGGARDLARLFAATLAPVDGVRLLSDADRDAMSLSRSRGMDRVLGFPTQFGSGVQRPFPLFPMLSPASFGHEAAGGSAVVADPALRLAVGFTTNVFPASRGASPAWLALQSTLRHLVENPEP